MKILVSFENRVRPDSTGVYILSAFKQLGHEVTHILPENMKDIYGGYDLYVKVDDGIYSAWNPELRNSHYFIIDSHIETGFRKKILEEGKFDTASVVHSQGLGVDWGRDDVYWNPVGCDPEIHNTGHWAKEYDGCFIGNFHNGLATPRVEMLDAFFKACPGQIFFGNRTFKDMTDKYGKSKLIFNRSINGDANMRVFEAMCSGSCLITDRVPDLDRLGFLDGVHYAGYNGPGDLTELTKYLLAHDDERERIAAAGRTEVMARHKYSDRITVLLEKIKLNTQEKIECPL